MKRETVQKILEEMETGYDSMAVKFSQTRKFFWRGLEFIRDYAQAGDKILDFGCGNGRLLELFAEKNIDYTGVDISRKLIGIATAKYPDEHVKFQKISGSDSLAFPANYFNVVYSIAVFHHLPGTEMRKKIAADLFRVVAPSGKIVVVVWNLWQEKYVMGLIRNWIRKLTFKSRLDWHDCYVSFADNQGNIFQRYHHVFTIEELEKLFVDAGFITEKCEIIGNNIVYIGNKK